MASKTREAGIALRDIRENTYGWTQRDVSNKTRDEYGEEIDQAVLSKIERGALAKPINLREAALLAATYRKPISWSAELYGVPVIHIEEGHYKEPVVDELYRVLDHLPANSPLREQLIRRVKYDIKEALSVERRIG